MFNALRIYWKAVIGTAVTWFILDITFYGNGLFTSTITSLLHKHKSETLDQKALDAVYIALIALPGYYLTVAFLDRIGRKNLQMWGFLLLSIFFFILGGTLDEIKKIPALAILVYGCTFLFSNFGPNATTYIIPGEYYPSEVRATCHGISAAAGKVGAAITSYTFVNLEGKIGTGNLLLFCGGVGILGLICTYFFVPNYTPQTLSAIHQQAEDSLRLLDEAKEGKKKGQGGAYQTLDNSSDA
jgi:PHS family inorganic phosphate transporter-like MFS transporter